MLLQKLREYAEGRLQMPPPMYQSTRIRWVIDLDGRGLLLGFVPTADENDRLKRGKERLAPTVTRSSGLRACLLADRADYALGLCEPEAGEGRRRRTAEAHHLFTELVAKCAEATHEPSVGAISRFLSELSLEMLSLPEGTTPSDRVTFRVAGAFPVDLPSVRQFWASQREVTGEAVQCLVCGRERPPAVRHPVKVKGIPGGQTSGMSLVSANNAAFESYGLRASLIAPVCQQCAEGYATAANALIRDESTHLRIGSVVYLFWTKEEVAFCPASILRDPSPEDVQTLLKSVFGGRAGATQLDVTPFYATALSASGGRVVVRDWLETTVGRVQQNLARYFAHQRLVERDGGPGNPVGLFALTASLAVRARDLPPRVSDSFVRAALAGRPLPFDLLDQAVRRARAEKADLKLTHPRIAVLKMVLISQGDLKEDEMEKLDPGNRTPAYLCGRLFAVLEQIQRAAIPGAGATIVDRFYGTASSAPASVFGTLLRGSQAHLAKLRKTREGAYHALQQRLEHIASGLPEFPLVLSMKEQALFALGYYHQRAQDRADAIARREERSAGARPADEADVD